MGNETDINRYKSSFNTDINGRSEFESIQDIRNQKVTDMLSPVCCFNVSLDAKVEDKKCLPNFPPTISVIVDPPSPSISIESKHNVNMDKKLKPSIRRSSGDGMEKCKLINNHN